MRVGDLEQILEKMAPLALAEPGDNCGLLVGDRGSPVRRVLAALEVTEAVVGEALGGGYDTLLTHHPLLFSPVRRLVESQPRERLVRILVSGRINLFSCHTNLDAAPKGLAHIAALALGLEGLAPLRRSAAGWSKLVGFIPQEAVEKVAAAVFAAGAGGIGDYQECAFAGEGRGWFTPRPGAHPVVGEVGRAEKTPEVRWETVVPRSRMAKAVAAYLAAHPYEEPAFDIYPIEDVWAHAGLGRVGALPEETTMGNLLVRVEAAFALRPTRWCGDTGRAVGRVAALPGSGRGLLDEAAEAADVLITGDLSYHDAERAAELGLSLIELPHGDFEWWAFRRWCGDLADRLKDGNVVLEFSREWRTPWRPRIDSEGAGMESGLLRDKGLKVRLWIDGGSRGNPGPSAIGVVLEDEHGTVIDTFGKTIGMATNNEAEYRALLAGLEMAERAGAVEVEVQSDSELMVKQILRQFRVKSEGLKPLHDEVERRAQGFGSFSIRHVSRDQNTRADALVNRALDEKPSH